MVRQERWVALERSEGVVVNVMGCVGPGSREMKESYD